MADRVAKSRRLCLAAIVLLAGSPAAFGAVQAAASRYAIDQRYGTIGFSVDQLGMFTAEGKFDAFSGTLWLDLSHPAQSRIDMTVDARSADMPSAQAAEMLRSPPYFDVVHHPDIHFTSTSVAQIAQDKFRISGTLEIRGVTQPQSFDAVLVNRHEDTARHAEIADFDVSGKLKRSAFGMTANQDFVGDAVTLKIHLRLTLQPDMHAG
jgi:polyisoprenoid-binding protein YceI